MNSRHNLLIGITGSVAAVRIKEIIPSFNATNQFNIKVIISKAAKEFTDTVITSYEQFSKDNNTTIYFDDEFEIVLFEDE